MTVPDRARDRLAPFLKWAGGKRSLLPQLLALRPKTIETYYEPFVGGGALFFELAGKGVFKQAILADRNTELIQCYRAIKDDPEKVISALGEYRYDESAFYEIRKQEPTRMKAPQRAARTIYLNRCGFNGLYRVNQDGRFNVPFGHYKNPRLIQPERLRRVAAALQNAQLVDADFERVVDNAGPGDFVYFDPPYVPVSATSNFTAYGRSGFGEDDQKRLATLLRSLGQRAVPALLSNSDCAATRKLYKGLPLKAVDVRRAINSNGAKRGPVSELLVRSFAYPTLRAKATTMAKPDDLQKQHEARIDAFIQDLAGGSQESDFALARALIHRGVHLAADRRAGEFCAMATFLSEMVGHAHGLMHPGDPVTGKHN